MIELKNVFLGYNKEYFALFDINLKIENGERILLVGQEGSGKTSLLRLIAGLDKQSKGEIYIDNTPIRNVDFKDSVSLGYLSSKAVFFESKSVFKNLAYVLKIRKVDKALWKEQIDKVLEEFNILHLSEERVGRLCRSDRRLVQMARLALRPLDILLCDDIEIGKDKTSSKIFDGLKKLLKKGKENKIVIIACDNSKLFKELEFKEIKMELGSLIVEEQSGQTR